MSKKVLLVLLMCLCLVSLAHAELLVTNGDFEADGDVGAIDDVGGWCDASTGSYWESAWLTNFDGVTPNGTNVVVFCSWNTAEGDPLTGSYLYQSIGTLDGETELTVSFDWGHPDDTAEGRIDGLVVSVLASDGSFVADDATDVLNAAGVTLLDYSPYDHVAAGTDGEVFPVEVALSLDGANAGDEIFLRFNNYLPSADADPWPILDNVQIVSEPVEDKIVYVDAVDEEGGNTMLTTGEVLSADDPGTVGSGSDNLWRERAFSNGGTIFEAAGDWSGANPEDCPRLATSVEVPEGTYAVYAYMWTSGGEDYAAWSLNASLEDSEGELPLYVCGDPNGIATLAVAEDFAEPVPIVAEADRTMWQIYLGTTDTTTMITVYIDDDAGRGTPGDGGNARTWYDGIGYKAVEPELPTIVWVTETADRDEGGVQDDQEWIDRITAAGYNLIVQPDRYLTMGDEKDPNDANDYVAELNAADVVIISRTASSGGYNNDANEIAAWASVTAPMISLSAYHVRSSRLQWIDSTTVNRSLDTYVLSLDDGHAVFDGVTLEDGLVEMLFTEGFAAEYMGNCVIGSMDAGNGTIIAQTFSDEIVIAEWPAGVAGYEGADVVQAGPRLLFCAGTQDTAGAVGQGEWNLSAAGEQMFFNSIEYMRVDTILTDGTVE